MARDCNCGYMTRSTTVSARSANLSYMWHGRGQRIRAHRQRLGLSQQALGRAVGVSHVTVRKWEESDSMEIKAGNLHKMAQLFGVDSASILTSAQGPKSSDGPLTIRESGDEHLSLRIASYRYSGAERDLLRAAFEAWGDAIGRGDPLAVLAARVLRAVFQPA
jgi:transcriptional regulator with XRE-family HTH domain